MAFWVFEVTGRWRFPVGWWLESRVSKQEGGTPMDPAASETTRSPGVLDGVAPAIKHGTKVKTRRSEASLNAPQ